MVNNKLAFVFLLYMHIICLKHGVYSKFVTKALKCTISRKLGQSLNMLNLLVAVISLFLVL